MNKQSILASSLAITLGVTGVSTVAGGHDAHAAEQTQTKYTVQQGDTLNKISHKFNVTVDQLKQWNGLKSDTIFIGQKLIVKGNTDQTIQTQSAQQTQNTQAQHVQTQNQNYTQSNQSQQAPQQGSQQTQHAEQVRTQQAPTNSQTQTPKRAETSKQVQQTQQSSQAKQSGGSVKLSNGNTAGATGSSAAQEMAKRTGVSASTWEHIIARESNGNPNARNASGAAGLFQTIGWGSTATVQDQINAAEKAYNAQGLSAWGM